MSIKIEPGTRRMLLLNLAGLAVLAALHPYLRFAPSPVLEWAGQLVAALGGAAVLYGAYFLLFRERGRKAWPRGYLMLAWFLVGSAVLVPYLSHTLPAAPPKQVTGAAPKPQSEIAEFLKDAPPHDPKAKPSSEIAEFLKDAPPSKAPSN